MKDHFCIAAIYIIVVRADGPYIRSYFNLSTTATSP